MLTFSKMIAQDHNQNAQCTDLSQIPFYLHSLVFSSIQFYHIIVFVSPKHTECLQYHQDPFYSSLPSPPQPLPLTTAHLSSILELCLPRNAMSWDQKSPGATGSGVTGRELPWSTALPRSQFRARGLHAVRESVSVVLHHPVGGTSSWKPQETNTAEKNGECAPADTWGML